jgi:hypothetical protein
VEFYLVPNFQFTAINLSFSVRATIKDCPYDRRFCRLHTLVVALKLMALNFQLGMPSATLCVAVYFASFIHSQTEFGN